MSRFTHRLLAGAALLVVCFSASAQYRRDDDRYGGGYGRGGVPVVDRVIAELNGSQYYSQNGRDHKYLDHARNDLFRFRENWYRGRFDRGRLDGAIDNIRRVVDSRWLNPRERSQLSRAMYDLRDLRSRGFDGGRYGQPGRNPY